MIGDMPKFYDSPYFVDEPGNWHLKPGAPEDVVKEFNNYMKSDLNSKQSLKKSGNGAKTFDELLK